MVITIILVIVIFILGILLWHYQRQVKNICRQLTFLCEQESNMPISTEINTGSIGKLKDCLNELLGMYRQQRKEYQDKENAIAQTYTNLSHDIRTPLTSLDGYFQLLQDCSNEEDKQRYIGIIKERISSLNDMLEELFTYTKLKNDTYTLALSRCHLNSILAKTVLSYYQDWTAKKIFPSLEITDTPLYIEANPQALLRVIQNILKNVLEHGQEEISILLRESSGAAALQVSNRVDNPGEINADRIFERFYKADEARGKTSTGLGLSIAYELVKKMNGEIHVKIEDNLFSVIMKFRLFDKI